MNDNSNTRCDKKNIDCGTCFHLFMFIPLTINSAVKFAVVALFVARQVNLP